MSVHEDRLARLARSRFRSRFRLDGETSRYARKHGAVVIRRQAQDFIRARLAPAEPRNDGRQTPWRGHPVFVAQHATACCCRGCLAKWHGIRAGRPLSEAEVLWMADLIIAWIARALERAENGSGR